MTLGVPGSVPAAAAGGDVSAEPFAKPGMPVSSGVVVATAAGTGVASAVVSHLERRLRFGVAELPSAAGCSPLVAGGAGAAADASLAEATGGSIGCAGAVSGSAGGAAGGGASGAGASAVGTMPMVAAPASACWGMGSPPGAAPAGCSRLDAGCGGMLPSKACEQNSNHAFSTLMCLIVLQHDSTSAVIPGPIIQFALLTKHKTTQYYCKAWHLCCAGNLGGHGCGGRRLQSRRQRIFCFRCRNGRFLPAWRRHRRHLGHKLCCRLLRLRGDCRIGGSHTRVHRRGVSIPGGLCRSRVSRYWTLGGGLAVVRCGGGSGLIRHGSCVGAGSSGLYGSHHGGCLLLLLGLGGRPRAPRAHGGAAAAAEAARLALNVTS